MNQKLNFGGIKQQNNNFCFLVYGKNLHFSSVFPQTCFLLDNIYQQNSAIGFLLWTFILLLQSLPTFSKYQGDSDVGVTPVVLPQTWQSSVSRTGPAWGLL